MYYRLDVEQNYANTFVRRVSHNDVLLTTGRVITHEITEPFHFEMEVTDPGYDLDPDYDGPPAVGPPWEPNIFDYYRNACVMHRRLIDVIRHAGADNIQTFPAIIERPETGELFPDYLAINIIGLVSCANLSASELAPIGDSHFFHNLVIHRSRTKDLLVFRLAEYPPEILIHARIAKEVRVGKFRGLRLDAVTESR